MRFAISLAGLDQSICPISFVILVVCVAIVSSCGVATISPLTQRVNTGTIVFPPSTAIRSNNCPVVSPGKISVSTISMISPVSSPSSICIMVTPVLESPLRIA